MIIILYFLYYFFLQSIVDSLKCFQGNLRPRLILQNTCDIVPPIPCCLAQAGVGGEEMTNMGCDGASYIADGSIVLVTTILDIKLNGLIDTSNVGSSSSSLRLSTNSPSG